MRAKAGVVTDPGFPTLRVPDLGELIAEHQGALYAFLLRMCGDPHQAEDLVQETFVRALRAAARDRPRRQAIRKEVVVRRRMGTEVGLPAQRPVADCQAEGLPLLAGVGVVAWNKAQVTAPDGTRYAIYLAQG